LIELESLKLYPAGLSLSGFYYLSVRLDRSRVTLERLDATSIKVPFTENKIKFFERSHT
jgi:hypothetical protein